MTQLQKVLCIHPDDSMLVALSDLASGDVVQWEDESILICTPSLTAKSISSIDTQLGV